MTERSPLESQIIALAGVAQSARIVDQISRTGSYPVEFLEASIHSLFSFDAPNVDAVFGNVQGVKLGLQNLADGFASGGDETTASMMRYLFSLLHLERKFSARSDLQQVVQNRLQHASYKATHFAVRVNDTCHNIAAIYADTLSTLPYRITINGSAQHLRNPANAEMIRALLLAGVRAAFLWRQLGGRRWKLLVKSGQICDTAMHLSRELGIQ